MKGLQSIIRILFSTNKPDYSLMQSFCHYEKKKGG